MFEKYGNFNSYEEINEKAAEFVAASDEHSLKELAKENGIDEDDAMDYLEEYTDCLCTVLSAAAGKIKVEVEDLKLDPKKHELINDWVEYIKLLASEDEEIRLAIRKKDKSLIGCLGKILAWSYDHRYDVDKRIVEASGIKMSGKVQLGISGSGTAKKIIREYYLGKKADER